MYLSPFDYFTDAVLRAPTIGSMFMCLASALVGVIVFLRKQSLLGETISHSAYPGVILGVLCAAAFEIDDSSEVSLTAFILTGALLTSLASLWTVGILERTFRIRSDSALCFVLASFFGIGLTIASRVQFTQTALYRQSQSYLYGQASTMVDMHIIFYGILSLLIALVIIWLYKELQIIAFDRSYAKSLGVPVKSIDVFFFFLVVFAVIVSIRSVGIVLTSAMLIAPPVAARQYTNKLSYLFLLAGIFGLVSGYLGNYLSVELTHYMVSQYTAKFRFIFPTGPMIVLVASGICFFSLLLAPERGLLVRFFRIMHFRDLCFCENILKAIWRSGSENQVTFSQISRFQNVFSGYLYLLLLRLRFNGWLKKIPPNKYELTLDGRQRAAHIVRLHRLWEVYLVDYLGMGVGRVHYNAEQIEHVLTPELEKELTVLLNDPKYDPHHQLIPPRQKL